MMKNLEGQLALITGAGGGFGRELTTQLLDAGCSVILTDVDDHAIETVCLAEQDRRNRIVSTVAADLQFAEGCQSVFDACRDAGRVPDLLINNAGIALAGRLDQVPESRWDALLQINLLAPMRLCQRFLPDMIARGSGHIVNISSLAGWVGSPGLSAYCAAKFGLRGFGEALAADLDDTGIVVSNVYPFFSRTPILDSPQYGYAERRTVPEDMVTEPADVVRKMIAGIRRNRLHIFPDRPSRQVHYLVRWMPWAIPFLNRRMQAKVEAAGQ